MASSIQILRSTIAQERPFPSSLLQGQPAINLNASEPGLFFSAADGSLIKIGPAAITSDGNPPNYLGVGQSGNCVGELWLDASTTPAVLKVFNGISWLQSGQTNAVTDVISANSAITVNRVGNTVSIGGVTNAVTEIVAGTNVTVSRDGNSVTINSTGGGGGGGSINFLRWIKTAVGGETTLSGVSNGVDLAYTPGLEEVFINGVLLTRSVDYTATNGTSITGLAPLTAGDVVTVVAITPIDIVQLPGQATMLRWSVQASAGQTVLSGSDGSGQTLAYTPGLEQVFVNGVFMKRGTDYTATNGTSVTLSVATQAGDEATVLGWSPFDLLAGIDGATIIDGTITGGKLAIGAVTGNKIAAATITGANLSAGSVGNTNIVDGSVTGAKIAAATITNANLSTGSVSSANIVDGTIVDADVNASAAIGSTKLSFTAQGSGATARTVSSKLRDVISIKDFGAVGDGVTDDTAAFNAVEALSGSSPIFMPAGRYLTTKGFYDLLNKKYEGPGQARLSGYYQAPERSFITTPQPIPSTDRTQLFNDGFPKAHRASYMFVGSGANPSPLPNTYQNFVEWSQDIIVHDFSAGFNTDPNDHQLGRSGAFTQTMRLYHGGQGDLVARNFYGEVYSSLPGATHWLANPALIVEGGNLGVTAPAGAGCYLNHSEYIFSDGGQPVACIDRVRNYLRTNSGNALNQVWIHDRPQSNGSQPIDAFYTPAGTGRRGFDVTPADFGADKAAICLKSGDRIYFDSSSTPDPLGAKWFATSLGTTYANFGSGALSFTVGGNQTLAISSTKVEVNSTTGGFVLPRMTTAQRDVIAAPQDGTLIYNTTTDKVQARAAGVWVDLH